MIPLSPKLSVYLVKKLAAREENHKAMRAVIEQLDTPKTYSGNSALQQDAVNLALKTFGLPPTASALYLETADDRETALERLDILEDDDIIEFYEDDIVKIYEDAVVEHDASKFRDSPSWKAI